MRPRLAALVACAALAVSAAGCGDSVRRASPTSGQSTATAAGEGTATPGAFEMPTITIRFVEDLNDNGVVDEGDGVPDTVPVNLTAWALSEFGWSLKILSDDTGKVSLTNVPPGEFGLRIYWPAGFVTDGATANLSNIWRALFSVDQHGDVIAPPTLPSTWPDPGSTEPLVVADGAPHLGRPPQVILLNRKHPNVIANGPELAAPLPHHGQVDVDDEVNKFLRAYAMGELNTPSPNEPTVELSTPAPTPPPPTPTPALPEEGGPPGGVIGGLVYDDVDNSRSRTDADQAPWLERTIAVELFGDYGIARTYVVVPDPETGRWEVRGLPDGVYRVRWAPAVRAHQLKDTIPPAQPIEVRPGETAVEVSTLVRIEGASRVLDLEFGAPLLRWDDYVPAPE